MEPRVPAFNPPTRFGCREQWYSPLQRRLDDLGPSFRVHPLDVFSTFLFFVVHMMGTLVVLGR